MTRSTATPPPRRRGTPAIEFRRQIEAATAAGVALGDMTLRLTLKDARDLKGDAAVALSEISFAGGTMRFLGVTVEQGGVPESVLERP